MEPRWFGIGGGPYRDGGNNPSPSKRTKRVLSSRGYMPLALRNEFDVVICSDVMEHIPDDKAAFLNLTQALKPGGYLLVTSPSVPQPRHLRSVAWREQRVGFEPSEYGHVRDGYSTDGLKSLFE